ncbi:MAG TPA: transglycosylase domain-containing protein [Solirubrobacteraceae bacterium]|nr:transglycosylase domain-containing protein [Solirubrobacteraceae bacterium]
MRLLVQRRHVKPLVVLRRAVLVLLAIVLAGLVAGAVYLISLRSVSDAQARTRRIMVANRETPGILPAPHRLVASVIAVEDEHFYDNVVINVLTGAGRAALATLQTSQDPGGSTIDQQLAKQLYGHGHGGLGSTLREIGLGVKLALRYSKQQILQMYLNVVYYGNGYWGVTQAAEGYFHTRPAQLTWPEAAMLAGLLQAPSAYDPLQHYALARQRQRHVLTQLVVNHYLTRAQANAALRSPLPLAH